MSRKTVIWMALGMCFVLLVFGFLIFGYQSRLANNRTTRLMNSGWGRLQGRTPDEEKVILAGLRMAGDLLDHENYFASLKLLRTLQTANLNLEEQKKLDQLFEQVGHKAEEARDLKLQAEQQARQAAQSPSESAGYEESELAGDEEEPSAVEYYIPRQTGSRSSAC